jgi:hypothetical protein
MFLQQLLPPERRKLDPTDVEQIARVCVTETIRNNVDTLLYLGEGSEAADVLLTNTLKSAFAWLQRQMRDGINCSDYRLFTPGQKYVVDHILDVEDTAWVPELGLSGKLDLTMCVTSGHTAKSTSSRGQPEAVTDGRIKISMPVELKTGKWNQNKYLSHRAQV